MFICIIINMYRIFLTIALAFFILTSCKKNEVVTNSSDLGVSYFPLSVGQVKIFSVDSIIYNSLSNTKDSVRSYIKEVITEMDKDSNGFTNYKVICYTTSDTAANWEYQSFYFYNMNNYLVSSAKGGIIKSLMIFPVSKGLSWDMNAYNMNGKKTVYYSYVGKPWMPYTDCVEIFFKEDINIVEETIEKYVFAKNKGMVYKILSEITINDSKRNGYSLITNQLR